MLKNNHIISILAVLILVSCARRSVEPDTLVSAAISISVGNILTSSAEVAVQSNQEKVVSCIITAPEKYEETVPYIDMDAVERYNYIIEHGQAMQDLAPVLCRKLDSRSKYCVGALGLDAGGNVITAPTFTTFETGVMGLQLGASFNGKTADDKYSFKISIKPDAATVEYRYVFGAEYVSKKKDELLEILNSTSDPVKIGSGNLEQVLESDAKKVALAALPFDMDGNAGDLSSVIVAGEMTLVTVDINGSVLLESLPTNENVFEGVVDVPAGQTDFTVTINGVQYGAIPYSGVAGVGTCTQKENIAYPAVGLNKEQNGTRPLTYTVSKSIGRMGSLQDGCQQFWTNIEAAGKMSVRIDLGNEDGIPRYYFRLVDADNIILYESFDLFAYSGDYLKPANGCAVDSTPDLVDGTEPGVMQAWNMTNAQGANKNEVGYKKIWYDYPEKQYGSVLANEAYIRNRDMYGWIMKCCGEKVGAVQLSVSTTNAFGYLSTPCLTAINGTEDVLLELDMARFSSSSKNDIAIRVEDGGVFDSGSVRVDGKEEVDLSEAVSSKNEYRAGYAANILPPSASNGAIDKPVSHFKFRIKGATSATRIVIDASVGANEKGDNAGASRCFVLDLKVSR